MASNKSNEKKNVFAITERDDKSYWVRVGAAFTNKDGSINVQLDALPVNGRLQIREDEDPEEREERRESRRGRR